MPAFGRTIGIDYSGAETPTASLKGLRVYLAEGDGHPVEVPPPQSLIFTGHFAVAHPALRCRIKSFHDD